LVGGAGRLKICRHWNFETYQMSALGLNGMQASEKE
jgi:hypothetical protein